jgi:hypothetical protein
MLCYAILLQDKELVNPLYAELCRIMQGIAPLFLEIDNKIDDNFISCRITHTKNQLFYTPNTPIKNPPERL